MHLGDPADALVWLSARDIPGLKAALADYPEVRWVQLPFAGIENAVEAGVIDRNRLWTCAKGSYAKPVAEHALLLALSGMRKMHERITARSWGQAAGTSLYGKRVAILGGGGITEELIRLLAPFGVDVTVMRRSPDPVLGAARTVGPDRLLDVIDGALVVFLALALTPATQGIIGPPELAAMGHESWLVNVARGRHVVTDALVAALVGGSIGGAGLDVTDPEPLPDGHPLWDAPNCIITPHTADTWDMIVPLLSDRIRVNVARFIAGEAMEGAVDPEAGY